MAKAIVTGIGLAEEQLERLGRESVRRIVAAGAQAAAERMQANIRSHGHIRTGSMYQNTRPGKILETYDGGMSYVYPYGEDASGMRNADKAYIINYGRRRRGWQGDRFITGDRKGAEKAVREAMEAESRRLLAEIT